MISPSVSADVTDIEEHDKAGGRMVMKIGKYQYQVTPADLAKEQQAFMAGEGVSSDFTSWSYIHSKHQDSP